MQFEALAEWAGPSDLLQDLRPGPVSHRPLPQQVSYCSMWACIFFFLKKAILTHGRQIVWTHQQHLVPFSQGEQASERRNLRGQSHVAHRCCDFGQRRLLRHGEWRPRRGRAHLLPTSWLNPHTASRLPSNRWGKSTAAWWGWSSGRWWGRALTSGSRGPKWRTDTLWPAGEMLRVLWEAIDPLEGEKKVRHITHGGFLDDCAFVSKNFTGLNRRKISPLDHSTHSG